MTARTTHHPIREMRRLTNTVLDIPDAELVLRALRNMNPRKNTPRWAAVMKAFALGSSYAHQLCERFNLDPDEVLK